MAISKDKVMLQIPVDKRVAKVFKNMVNELHIHQGDLFILAFAELLKSVKKGGEKNGKENNKVNA